MQATSMTSSQTGCLYDQVDLIEDSSRLSIAIQEDAIFYTYSLDTKLRKSIHNKNNSQAQTHTFFFDSHY